MPPSPPPDRGLEALACALGCELHKRVELAAASRDVIFLEQVALFYDSSALRDLLVAVQDAIARRSAPPEGT